MSGMTALQYMQEKPVNRISFGCELIDCTIGKLVARGITEISGEAGAGKTQLCLALAIQSILSLDKSAIIANAAIVTCGEGLFPVKRLSQLAQHFERHDVNPAITVKSILSCIHIEQCANTEEATETLYKRVPELCRDGSVRLLIIDSLAGMVRHVYNTRRSDQARDRTSYLFTIAQQLKWLSDTFNIGIIAVNQVTGVGFADQTISADMRRMSCIPALGLAWSTCVNTRYMITRSNYHHTLQCLDSPTFTENSLFVDENFIEGNSGISGRPVADASSKTTTHTSSSSRRSLELIFSPVYPRSSCHFEICSRGIQGIS